MKKRFCDLNHGELFRIGGNNIKYRGIVYLRLRTNTKSALGLMSHVVNCDTWKAEIIDIGELEHKHDEMVESLGMAPGWEK